MFADEFLEGISRKIPYPIIFLEHIGKKIASVIAFLFPRLKTFFFTCSNDMGLN